MTKILHIIQQLSLGGAARSLIATAKYSSKQSQIQHQVISLLPLDKRALELAQGAGISVINAPDKAKLEAEIQSADIVQVHFWNVPELYEFLRSKLPPMRLVIWFHIAGDKPPQVVTKSLIDYADFAIACSPYTYENSVFQSLAPEVKLQKTGMVYGAADFDRLSNLQPQPHSTFNVGYIGTVHFSKLHRNYVPMSAAIAIPNIRFIICGPGMGQYLQQQAQQLGVGDRFEVRDYVEDIKSVIETLDVYGYPLCEDTYAAAELNLQEVMYAGVPPVVFPYGGVKQLVVDNYTGLIVRSELEYKQAIEYLYHHPEERVRLGRNAKEYASQIFGAEIAAKQLNQIYKTLMQRPKQEREWGVDRTANLLQQTVSFRDIMGASQPLSGADLFIESLGDTAPQFATSMRGQELEELWASDSKIASSSILLASYGSGGILHYKDAYPDDGYLRFWSGLILQQQQQHTEAIGEFQKATALGCNHWRIFWYIAQSAAQVNNIPLTQQALSTVLQNAPDFSEAQQMRDRLGSIPPQKPAIPASSNPLNTLQQTRQELAQQWLNTPAEQLQSAYLGELGTAHKALLESGIKHHANTPDEQALIRQLSSGIVWGLDAPNALQSFIAATLYCYPHQLQIPYTNAPIPKWFAQDYLKFMFASPTLFHEPGEVEQYYRYVQGWVKYVHQKIFSNSDSPLWQSVAEFFTQGNANFAPLYFSHANLKSVYIKRAEIIEFALNNRGFEVDYVFPPRSTNRPKIRLGILKNHFNSATETLATLPVFEHLDRQRFEIVLYANQVNGSQLEGYCQSRADRLVKLPEPLSEQVQTLRNEDLDILFIGTNITELNKPLTALAQHRLARVQVTSIASPVTTGIRNIDYYIAGNLTAPTNTNSEQYREKLVNIEGSGLCFRFPLPEPASTVNPTRASWGATEQTVVFMSGANFYKIIPELTETWAKILAAVPNSILVLYPFGPAWSSNYPALPFLERLHRIFAQHGIDKRRLVLINTLPSPADIKECVKLADVYLDSYPYSGATSLLDPLQLGIPAIAWEENSLKSRQASALLREIHLADLIAQDESSYIQLATKLATNPQLRHHYRQQIQQQMQQNPPFLDSAAYSKKMGNLFEQLFQGGQTSAVMASATPTQSPSKPVSVSQEFLNRLIGCANLYYIDPSDESIQRELLQLRREFAELWLQIPSDRLRECYTQELGKAHQSVLNSGIQNQPLPETEQPFVQELIAKLTPGLDAPLAINAVLALLLYQQRDRLPQFTQPLPDWLHG